jgi:hypothetical protein
MNIFVHRACGEMERNPFTSSLQISPKVYCLKGVGAGGVTPSPLPHPLSQLSHRNLFKDDVTAIFLLGISFMLILLKTDFRKFLWIKLKIFVLVRR